MQSRLGEFVSGNFFQTFGIAAWRGCGGSEIEANDRQT